MARVADKLRAHADLFRTAEVCRHVVQKQDRFWSDAKNINNVPVDRCIRLAQAYFVRKETSVQRVEQLRQVALEGLGMCGVGVRERVDAVAVSKARQAWPYAFHFGTEDSVPAGSHYVRGETQPERISQTGEERLAGQLTSLMVLKALVHCEARTHLLWADTCCVGPGDEAAIEVDVDQHPPQIEQENLGAGAHMLRA